MSIKIDYGSNHKDDYYVPTLTWTLSRVASSLYLSAVRATSLPPGRTMPPVTSLVRGTARPATYIASRSGIRSMKAHAGFWMRPHAPGISALPQRISMHTSSQSFCYSSMRAVQRLGSQCYPPRAWEPASYIWKPDLFCVLPQEPHDRKVLAE